MKPTLALSIRQPWAWLILHAGKDVENRSRGTSFRGRIYVHAGKSYDQGAPREISPLLNNAQLKAMMLYAHLPRVRGAIVGEVDIVDCWPPSPHFNGGKWADLVAYHWHLANPVAYDQPIPCRGQLGLWAPPEVKA